MGHIVKLYEEAYHIEAMDGPTEIIEADVDQSHRQSLNYEIDPHRQEGLGIVGFSVLIDMLVEGIVLGFKFGIRSHRKGNFNKLMQ